jgi:hypothetical protein
VLKSFCALSVAFAILTGSQAFASQVTAAAEVKSGLSYAADPATANSNPAISGNPTLKQAVTAGDDLLSGNFVLIGSFNLTDAQIQANAMNVAFLTSPANFIQYGVLHISDGYPGIAGVFTGTLTNNTTTLGIAGKQIYMMVIAATNNSTLAAAVSSAFQVGVFYQDKTAMSSWAFKAENAVPNTTSIDLSDLTVGDQGLALSPFAHVVVGSFGPDKSNTFPAASNFALASAVPEPSTAALLGLAAVGALLRRRRNA